VRKEITMKNYVSIFAMMLCVAFPAHAQTLYHVEIIAFARDSAEADNEENGNKSPRLRYPEKITALQPDGSGASQFQRLPAETLLLNNEAATLKNRRNMRVLAHIGWQQSMEDTAHATSVLVSGGKQVDNHHELEGSVTLSIEHFLRADINLWFNRFAANGTVDAVVLPNVPGMVAEGGNPAYVATQTVLLQEQRRLRSGELHYFDHPKFGLLMLVKPVNSAPAP